MNKITIGTTYYENPKNLFDFLNCNTKQADEIIIVDDGSTKYPISNFLHFFTQKNIRVYRIKEDYGFNSHGCRNLIVSKSQNPWILLLDCDREMLNPQSFYTNIQRKKLKENVLYKFLVHSFEIGNNIHQSVNDFLIHKKHFFSVGGYDEELIGIRDGDRFFLGQLKNYGSERTLTNCEIMITRKSSKKDPTVIVSNLDKIDKGQVMQKIAQRLDYPEPNKPILTFYWERLL